MTRKKVGMEGKRVREAGSEMGSIRVREVRKGVRGNCFILFSVCIFASWSVLTLVGMCDWMGL